MFTLYQLPCTLSLVFVVLSVKEGGNGRREGEMRGRDGWEGMKPKLGESLQLWMGWMRIPGILSTYNTCRVAIVAMGMPGHLQYLWSNEPLSAPLSTSSLPISLPPFFLHLSPSDAGATFLDAYVVTVKSPPNKPYPNLLQLPILHIIRN